MKWLNAPSEPNPVLLKIAAQADPSAAYSAACFCVASAPKCGAQGVICVCGASASIVDKCSGKHLHTLRLETFSVALANDDTEAWFGSHGKVTVIDVKSGHKSATIDLKSIRRRQGKASRDVVWLKSITGHGRPIVIAGTGHRLGAIS